MVRLLHRGGLANLRYVCRLNGHIPLCGNHLAADRQVGERASTRLDVVGQYGPLLRDFQGSQPSPNYPELAGGIPELWSAIDHAIDDYCRIAN